MIATVSGSLPVRTPALHCASLDPAAAGDPSTVRQAHRKHCSGQAVGCHLRDSTCAPHLFIVFNSPENRFAIFAGASLAPAQIAKHYSFQPASGLVQISEDQW